MFVVFDNCYIYIQSVQRCNVKTFTHWSLRVPPRTWTTCWGLTTTDRWTLSPSAPKTPSPRRPWVPPLWVRPVPCPSCALDVSMSSVPGPPRCLPEDGHGGPPLPSRPRPVLRAAPRVRGASAGRAAESQSVLTGVSAAAAGQVCVCYCVCVIYIVLHYGYNRYITNSSILHSVKSNVISL